MISDFRYAFRSLHKTPGFSIVAIAVLTLGIGLNTAMFSFVYAMAFESRPFPDSAEVVQVFSRDRDEPNDWQGFSYPTFQALSARTDLFEGVLAQSMSMVGIGDGAITRRAFSAFVSADYFGVLQVSPLRGRTFSPAETSPGAEMPVVIASYPYWQKTGFKPDLVGSTLRINERVFTVIGIMPEAFSGTMMLIGTEFYLPLGMYDALVNNRQGAKGRALEQADVYDLMVVARLRGGVTPESASEALAAMATHREAEDPVTNDHQTMLVGPLPRLGAATSPMNEAETAVLAIVLLALTAAVLLLVCLNLTGLLLARGHSRRRELAIRLALGSGRARIIRQLLVEGLVLSIIGGGLGFLAAVWASDLMLGTLSSMLPIPIFFGGTGTAIGAAATLGFCGLATLMFALGPALRLSRTDALSDLKQLAGDDATKPRRCWLPKHPLVVTQIAVSLALLIVAGLFIRMAHVATHLDFGYKADATLIAEVDAHLGGMNDVQSLQTYRTVEDRLAGLPGIESVSLAATAPYSNFHMARRVRRAGPEPAEDATPATPEEGRAYRASWNAVGANYFSTMGVPVLRGRSFSAVETSDPKAPPVVIIDEALARILWPDSDALGQFVQFERDDDQGDRVMQIIGITRSIRGDMFEREPTGAVFEPFGQGSLANIHLHLRATNPNPAAVEALIDPVRNALTSSAPGLPVLSVKTFVDHRQNSTEFWAMRLVATLFLLFGVLALLIAVIGIYGIKAYAVARRTREIGIRMALGAHPRQVRRMFFREGLVQTSLGISLGLLLGIGVGIVLNSIMVDMNTFDPLAFIGAAMALSAATLLAGWLPARRASAVDPNIALRAE
jgi:predicted permease